jgi:hypothetical protein
MLLRDDPISMRNNELLEPIETEIKDVKIDVED